MDVRVADEFIILYETIFSFLLQLLVFVSKEVFFILSPRRFTLVISYFSNYCPNKSSPQVVLSDFVKFYKTDLFLLIFLEMGIRLLNIFGKCSAYAWVVSYFPEE